MADHRGVALALQCWRSGCGNRHPMCWHQMTLGLSHPNRLSFITERISSCGHLTRQRVIGSEWNVMVTRYLLLFSSEHLRCAQRWLIREIAPTPRLLQVPQNGALVKALCCVPWVNSRIAMGA